MELSNLKLLEEIKCSHLATRHPVYVFGGRDKKIYLVYQTYSENVTFNFAEVNNFGYNWKKGRVTDNNDPHRLLIPWSNEINENNINVFKTYKSLTAYNEAFDKLNELVEKRRPKSMKRTKFPDKE